MAIRLTQVITALHMFFIITAISMRSEARPDGMDHDGLFRKRENSRSDDAKGRNLFFIGAVIACLESLRRPSVSDGADPRILLMTRCTFAVQTSGRRQVRASLSVCLKASRRKHLHSFVGGAVRQRTRVHINKTARNAR